MSGRRCEEKCSGCLGRRTGNHLETSLTSGDPEECGRKDVEQVKVHKTSSMYADVGSMREENELIEAPASLCYC